MDLGKIGLAVVGGVVLYLIANTMVGTVIITGTTTSDEMLKTLLPIIVAGGVLIAVLVNLMRRTP